MKQLAVPKDMAVMLTANAFTCTGYRFTGWNTAADGSGTAYDDRAPFTPTDDTTLYAQWQKIEVEVEDFDSKGYEYTGKAIEPEVKVTDKNTGTALVKGTDFNVEYVNNVHAGDSSKAVITFIGSYADLEKQEKSFKITPKPLTITAKDQTKVQGEDDPELTYDVDGLVEGDSMSGKLEREPGEDPGTYTIKKGTLTAGSDYDIVKFTEGTLTITAKATQAPTPTEAPAPGETSAPTEAPAPGETSAPTEAPAPGETSAPTEAPAPGETSAPTEAPTPTEKPGDEDEIDIEIGRASCRERV